MADLICKVCGKPTAAEAMKTYRSLVLQVAASRPQHWLEIGREAMSNQPILAVRGASAVDFVHDVRCVPKFIELGEALAKHLATPNDETAATVLQLLESLDGPLPGCKFECECGMKFRNVKRWPLHCRCGRIYASATAQPTGTPREVPEPSECQRCCKVPQPKTEW